ncbi:TetR/AcrR family transcriptional regulator [Bacillus halotolerans]|uniref:TetR/AcrR family transcriptional regulator n=1 Tax=Bacillus halotolerans TaxID=260554 RepID=UPI0007503A90|nr:TetR/AcrR family transcriptional regulator [Bacillus halotolerans]KUP28826.1 TetR family transcriptional regulator [Bacillus halotolerans]MBL4975514.1 TetR/AcrR family transcriptional regulator [Bacillus halotolerans]MEC0251964.1 TetR/AcrR family transcriptional regulator [Bacillus halotolerans]MEC0359714.1 TetR/AcrR family transcriptional regulator [Bacillus halotolerans]PHI47580.1 TetR family transcriptional regulator [Bacillus halotolerans]
MGRNKEFDTALVLRRAIEVFGEYGYEGTSLQELLSHLGIARQSLYDTYGTKRDLFLSAVKTYLEGKNAAVVERLEAPGSVKEAIRDIFQEGVNVLKDPERSKACFIINSAIEQIPHDPDLARYFEGQTKQLETAFYQALRRAQAEGELKEHLDISALARYLNQSRLSLTFIAKVSADFNQLQDYVEVSLSVLD